MFFIMNMSFIILYLSNIKHFKFGLFGRFNNYRFKCSNYLYSQRNEVRDHTFSLVIEDLTRRLSLISDHQTQNHLRYLFFTKWRYNDGEGIEREGGYTVLSRLQFLFIRLSHYVCMYAGLEYLVLEIWRQNRV